MHQEQLYLTALCLTYGHLSSLYGALPSSSKNIQIFFFELLRTNLPFFKRVQLKNQHGKTKFSLCPQKLSKGIVELKTGRCRVHFPVFSQAEEILWQMFNSFIIEHTGDMGMKMRTSKPYLALALTPSAHHGKQEAAKREKNFKLLLSL